MELYELDEGDIFEILDSPSGFRETHIKLVDVEDNDGGGITACLIRLVMVFDQPSRKMRFPVNEAFIMDPSTKVRRFLPVTLVPERGS